MELQRYSASDADEGKRLAAPETRRAWWKRCYFAPMDFVENRMRSPGAAAFSLFVLFVPIYQALVLGPLGLGQVRDRPAVAVANTSFVEVASAIALTCFSENLCNRGVLLSGAFACRDSRVCLDLLNSSAALNVTNEPSAPPFAPPPSAPPPTDEATGKGLDFVIAFNVAILVGNSAFHSPLHFLPVASVLAIVAVALYAAAVCAAPTVGIESVSLITALVGQAAIVAFYLPMLARLGLVGNTCTGDASGRKRSASAIGNAIKTFSQTREEAYAAYAHALVNRRVSGAERALQRGVKAGSLTFKERSRLEEEVRKEFTAEFGYKAQLLGLLRDATVGGQAIELPTRFSSAFLVSSCPRDSSEMRARS